MPNSIPSLQRALQAMPLLLERGEGLTPAELARRAPLPRATAFRVLKTLEAAGMAEARNGRYLPGPKLVQMAVGVLDRCGVRSAALPILRRLTEAVGQTAHLATRSGDRVVLVEVRDSSQLVRVASRPGTLVWMHCSSTGKAILATLPEEDARQTVERAGFERQTDRTHRGWDQLALDLRRVRRKGYAVDDREYNDDIRCVAAAVPTGGESSEWAIGVTGPASAVTRSVIPEIGTAVKAAADELGAACSAFGGVGERTA